MILPSLGAEETLSFFTHSSIRTASHRIDVFFGDHEALEELGREMLRPCVYEAFVRDNTGFEFSVETMKVSALLQL